MKNSFKVSYVTTLPKEGNAPRVTITGSDIQTYRVRFYEFTTKNPQIISEGECKTNQTILAKTKQWYTPWGIAVYDKDNRIVFTDDFNLNGKVVFIKMDAYALGDTIAWIPYVEVFRKKHNCKVICSTFHNDILVKAYPMIMFAKPNTQIENIYAQYYIGASNDENPYYSPIKVNEYPLQDVASRILGLNPMEIRPDLGSQISHIPSRIEGEYVTLSEFGSAENKHWKGDWQQVVNYFIERGIEVVIISKEKTSLTGVTDKSGDFPLIDRMIDLKHAKMHLGVSSGLSWLAWSVGTHVLMISDVTPNFHEFQSGVTRLNANNLDAVNYLADSQTSIEEVLKKVGEMGVS
jgi:autotransporter strand-loop-strand O-heptosyltransferase